MIVKSILLFIFLLFIAIISQRALSVRSLEDEVEGSSCKTARGQASTHKKKDEEKFYGL
jgi:hypothetical protein